MIIRTVLFLFFLGLLIYPASTYIFRHIFIYADPFYELTVTLYKKEVTVGILIILVYILLVYLFNNFFCRDICPIGYILQEIPGKKVAKKKFQLSSYLFWGILILSLVSVNVSGLFDPFVFFTQLGSSFHQKGSWPALLLVIPVCTLLLLNSIEKRFWCRRLCPLGYFFNFLVFLKQKVKKIEGPLNLKKEDTDNNLPALTRRSLLFTLSVLAVKIWYPALSFSKGLGISRALRPPGALPEADFKNSCLKCGTCIRVCPTHVLRPAYLEFGLSGIATPSLDPSRGFCAQFCTQCGEVCPVQAIVRINEFEKQAIKIGEAKIDKKRCLCHAESVLCLICYESCPYQAITVVNSDNNFSAPYVNRDICVGCGKCEYYCPVKPSPAIMVYNREKT